MADQKKPEKKKGMSPWVIVLFIFLGPMIVSWIMNALNNIFMSINQGMMQLAPTMKMTTKSMIQVMVQVFIMVLVIYLFGMGIRALFNKNKNAKAPQASTAP